MMMNLHIVFRKNCVCIVKNASADWRDLQARFADYKASLGPWSAEQVANYWSLDYGTDKSKWPFQREEIEAFARSETDVLEGSEN
jgi:hypothetical protein